MCLPYMAGKISSCNLRQVGKDFEMAEGLVNIKVRLPYMAGKISSCDFRKIKSHRNPMFFQQYR